LLEVDSALARIEAGAYGICRICGEAIEEARLHANPAAPPVLHTAKGNPFHGTTMQFSKLFLLNSRPRRSIIDVEVDLSKGLNAFSLVGYQVPL